MATLRETVEYVLTLEGDIEGKSRGAAQAIREAEQAADKATNAVEKLGRMGGGAAGELTGAFADARDVLMGLEASIGAVGVAAGAAVLAVGALALGTRALADATVEARDRLTEQGLASEIPADALASVEAYDSATQSLRNSLDLLTVQAGGPALDLLTDLADVTGGVVGAFLDAREATAGWRETIADTFEPMSQLTTAIVTLGLSVPLRAFADYSAGVREMRDETARLNAEVERGMEKFRDSFVQPELVGAPTGNTMSQGDMYAALGMTSPDAPLGSPRTARAPARAAADAGDPYALGDQIFREGNIAARERNEQIDDLILELAAGGDMTDRNTEALAASTTSAEELGAALEANTNAAAQSVAETTNLIGVAIGTLTGVLDIPGQFREVVNGLPDQLDQAAKDTARLFDRIPEVLGTLISETLPRFLSEQLPRIAASFATMPIEITKALIEGAPEFAASLIEMVPQMAIELASTIVGSLRDFFSPSFWADMGQALIDAIGGAFRSAGRDVGSLLDTVTFGVFTPGRNETEDGGRGTTRGARSGIPYIDPEDDTGPRGYRPPKGDTGGQSSRMSGGGGLHMSGVTIVAPNARDVARQLREMQGTYGLNESTAGWV